MRAERLSRADGAEACRHLQAGCKPDIRVNGVSAFPAGPEYRVKTKRFNQMWQMDATYLLVTKLGLTEMGTSIGLLFNAGQYESLFC